MGTYIGYYRLNEDFQRELGAKARDAEKGVQDDRFRARVIGARDILPAGMKLLGSYAPVGGGGQTKSHPGVWIVEANDPQDLTVITTWYQGFMDFEWVPATSVGATSAETTAALDAEAARS